jgi:hypothetical protein
MKVWTLTLAWYDRGELSIETNAFASEQAAIHCLAYNVKRNNDDELSTDSTPEDNAALVEAYYALDSTKEAGEFYNITECSVIE